jgi:NAD(P)-dependent dehydrogenase (short-subunit alcohol dehydrogenase family)/thiol-disulfide isomerase/thioredoxin
MGADAARRLAADGFNVAVLSSSGKGEALAHELGGLGLTGSNQSVADMERFVEMAMNAWGRIDVLVNSAGHGPKGPVLDLTDEDWHAGLDVYLLNVIRPTRLVTPIMRKQEGGAIINISTFATFEPDPLFPSSGVFRAGLAAFTKLFADNYAVDNLRMNNVLPGFIDSLPETEERRARIPMGRYGKAAEVASAIREQNAQFAAGRIGGQVKSLLAFVLLAGAVFFAQPVLPGPFDRALWWLLGVVVAAWALTALVRGPGTGARVLPALSLAVAALGAGAALNGSKTGLQWQPYSAAAVQQARDNGRPVLIEFTADWCINCKVLERTVYAAADVAEAADRARLAAFRVDMTEFTDEQTALLERYGGAALPHAVLLDAGDGSQQTFTGMFSQKTLIEAIAEAGE